MRMQHTQAVNNIRVFGICKTEIVRVIIIPVKQAQRKLIAETVPQRAGSAIPFRKIFIDKVAKVKSKVDSKSFAIIAADSNISIPIWNRHVESAFRTRLIIIAAL